MWAKARATLRSDPHTRHQNVTHRSRHGGFVLHEEAGEHAVGLVVAPATQAVETPRLDGARCCTEDGGARRCIRVGGGGRASVQREDLKAARERKNTPGRQVICGTRDV